jgi:hypothetical protein
MLVGIFISRQEKAMTRRKHNKKSTAEMIMKLAKECREETSIIAEELDRLKDRCEQLAQSSEELVELYEQLDAEHNLIPSPAEAA